MAGNRTTRSSPARKSTPRKAAPRRAATQADGGAAGDAADQSAEVASPSPDALASELNGKAVDAPPAKDDDKEPPDEAMKSGYPRGTLLYEWEGPKGKIVIPHVLSQAKKMNKLFFYNLYHSGAMTHEFTLIDMIGLPYPTTASILDLPEAMNKEFWNGWWAGLKDQPPDYMTTSAMPGESSR